MRGEKVKLSQISEKMALVWWLKWQTVRGMAKLLILKLEFRTKYVCFPPIGGPGRIQKHRLLLNIDAYRNDIKENEVCIHNTYRFGFIAWAGYYFWARVPVKVESTIYGLHSVGESASSILSTVN